MRTCQGFRPGCTNEATHTDMGYAFCLDCARQFAGYTPPPLCSRCPAPATTQIEDVKLCDTCMAAATARLTDALRRSS